MSATQIPYTYRVERKPGPARNPWQLFVIADSKPDRLADYATRAKAISAARLLAGWRGNVEVRT